MSIIRRLAIDEGPIIINEPIDSIGVASSTLGARISVADQMLGYLLVESGVHGFYNASHADRLGAIADQAGAAISNARLAGRASELAAAEERQRLAHELHDAVNQTLWTAAITAESLLREVDESSPLHHHVSRLHRLTRGALSEMRALLLELRPSDLIEVSLPDLIDFLLMALECRRTLQVDVSVDDVDLPPDAHLVFYRITQEALRNITHHAGARRGVGATHRRTGRDAHDRRRRARLRPDERTQGTSRTGDHARARRLDRRPARHHVRPR